MTKFDRWRKAYEAYLTGELFSPDTPDGQRIVASVERIAEDSSKAPKISVPFCSPTIHLRALAAAFRTPGSKYYGKEDTLNEIKDYFKKVEEIYNLQTPPDNWWAVEVGNPLRILDTLILVYDYIEEKCIPTDRNAIIAHWTDIILHFQNAYSLTSRGGTETGANMMWKCHIHILLGILRKDQTLIDWAKEQMPGMLSYAHKITHPQAGSFYDDGFYPDGSFIQHYFFAYTGGYGKHFLSILSGLLYAFRDTDLNIVDKTSMEFLCDMIQKAYAPLIVDGRFMDIARGREPSRYFCQDEACGRLVMRSLCYLSEAVPRERKAEISSLLKLWLSRAENRDRICVDEDAYAEYYVYPSLAEVLDRLDREETAAAPLQRGHYNFGPMCKTVHRHGRWSAAISMYSKTTACYEYLNGESVKFWHMGDGVTYLYTEDSDQYNDDFYATVDMQRLPGTTVDRSPSRAQDPYYTWFQPESKNVYAFAGGASLGSYGIAGMQYRGQGRGKERSLEVKKSWFFLGEEIVCLGSGITSSTGDPVETTVLNHRLLKGGSNLMTLDGHSFAVKELAEGKKVKETLHLSGNKGPGSDIGVVFPKGGKIHTLYEYRSGTWNHMEIIPDFVQENEFATIWMSHGTNPQNEEYAYILLPGVSAEETACYAEKPQAEILECSAAVHGVWNRTTNLYGFNFWEEAPGKCAGIEVSTQASVILHKEKEAIQLAVSDPTKSDQKIKVKLNCNVSQVIKKEEGIEILSMAPLEILVDTAGWDGQSLHLTARM